MKDWKRSDKIALAGLVLGLVGFVFVIWQIALASSALRQAELHERAQLLVQLHERATGAPGNAEVFRKIEYNTLEWSPEFHRSADQENLVRLLSLLELIARLESLGLVEFSDVDELFGYYIVRIHENEAVQKYLQFLRRRVEIGEFPADIAFPAFTGLAERIVASAASRSNC